MSEALQEWKEVASNLDSHKVSSVRPDLGMASCGLWEPTERELDRLNEAANELGLVMREQANGPSIPDGRNFTVWGRD